MQRAKEAMPTKCVRMALACANLDIIWTLLAFVNKVRSFRRKIKPSPTDSLSFFNRNRKYYKMINCICQNIFVMNSIISALVIFLIFFLKKSCFEKQFFAVSFLVALIVFVL